LLALRVGGEPSTLNPLHPGRAPDRDHEQEQKAGEQEADASLDHRWSTLPSARRLARRPGLALKASTLPRRLRQRHPHPAQPPARAAARPRRWWGWWWSCWW